MVFRPTAILYNTIAAIFRHGHGVKYLSIFGQYWTWSGVFAKNKEFQNNSPDEKH